jgi:hypothetical protein
MTILSSNRRLPLLAAVTAIGLSACTAVDPAARDQAAAASQAAQQAQQAAEQLRADQLRTEHQAQVAAAEAQAASDRADFYYEESLPRVIVSPIGHYEYEETVITRTR